MRVSFLKSPIGGIIGLQPRDLAQVAAPFVGMRMGSVLSRPESFLKAHHQSAARLSEAAVLT